jgi:Co/Zn/Cd efflux system component
MQNSQAPKQQCDIIVIAIIALIAAIVKFVIARRTPHEKSQLRAAKKELWSNIINFVLILLGRLATYLSTL